jgi:hypothetical protein
LVVVAIAGHGVVGPFEISARTASDRDKSVSHNGIPDDADLVQACATQFDSFGPVASNLVAVERYSLTALHGAFRRDRRNRFACAR